MEWPGMNQVVRRPCRRNSSSSRGVPTSPANRPRLMSFGEFSPPYEPSQPPTASTSTPYAQRMSLAIAFLLDHRGLPGLANNLHHSDGMITQHTTYGTRPGNPPGMNSMSHN